MVEHFNIYLLLFPFKLSRLEVESLTPRWEKTNDLKNTRFSDPITQKIMNFKCVSWQLLRIEARSIEGDADTGEARKGFSSPLRLITNNGKCRITIKKSHVDGSLICGRMQTILEEVLWIVTLPQLRSAISFGKHILELVKKSAEPSNSPEKVVKSIVGFCHRTSFRNIPELHEDSKRGEQIYVEAV